MHPKHLTEDRATEQSDSDAVVSLTPLPWHVCEALIQASSVNEESLFSARLNAYLSVIVSQITIVTNSIPTAALGQPPAVLYLAGQAVVWVTTCSEALLSSASCSRQRFQQQWPPPPAASLPNKHLIRSSSAEKASLNQAAKKLQSTDSLFFF